MACAIFLCIVKLYIYIALFLPTPPAPLKHHEASMLKAPMNLKSWTCLTIFAMMVWSWSALYQMFINFRLSDQEYEKIDEKTSYTTKPADLSHLGEDFPSRITTMLVLWLCKVTGISHVVKCCHCGRLSSPKPNSILPKLYCICGSRVLMVNPWTGNSALVHLVHTNPSVRFGLGQCSLEISTLRIESEWR